MRPSDLLSRHNGEMKTSKVILAAAVALLTAAVLAACGSTTKVPQPTRLTFGQSMKVSPSLEITVTGVKKVPVKTLSRFPKVKHTDQPYFVYVKVTNIGKTDLGGTPIPLYLQDSHNGLNGFWPIGNTFAACPSRALPKKFAPNASLSTCLIYVLGEGNSATMVSYRPDMAKPAITWSGTIAGQSAAPSSKATH